MKIKKFLSYTVTVFTINSKFQEIDLTFVQKV